MSEDASVRPVAGESPRSSRAASRRTVLGWAGGAGVGGAAGFLAGRRTPPTAESRPGDASNARLVRAESTTSSSTGLPAGVAAPIPAHGHIIAIDLADSAGENPEERAGTTRKLLVEWTTLAEQLSRRSNPQSPAAAGSDMLPASLEFTIGFGASLLQRCGMQGRQPKPLVSLPAFAVDELVPQKSDGDFMLQLGAEDPMRLASAVQAVLATLGDRAQVRWSTQGFGQSAAAANNPHQTGRNIMGHRDGTGNPDRGSPLWELVVTAREDAAATRWMNGGSYAVVRQIEIDLEGWFALTTTERDKVIGRQTTTGAALGHDREGDPVEFARRNESGELMIDRQAHIRLSSAENVAGQRIFRRSWNFDHGPQAYGREAGMLFVAWQSDPRRGFIPIQRALDDGQDLLSTHVRHVGSGVFAVPPHRPGDPYIGYDLFGS